MLTWIHDTYYTSRCPSNALRYHVKTTTCEHRVTSNANLPSYAKQIFVTLVSQTPKGFKDKLTRLLTHSKHSPRLFLTHTNTRKAPKSYDSSVIFIGLTAVLHNEDQAIYIFHVRAFTSLSQLLEKPSNPVRQVGDDKKHLSLTIAKRQRLTFEKVKVHFQQTKFFKSVLESQSTFQ